VSQFCAAALPHALYWTTAGVLSFWSNKMRPFGSDVQVVVYLATQTPLIPLLQVAYPLVETLACIWHDAEDPETDARTSHETQKKNNNQRRLQHHQQQLESVLDYWTLHAAQRLVGAAVSSLPFVSSYILTSTFSRVAHLWWALYVAALLHVSMHHSFSHGEHKAEGTARQSSRIRRPSVVQPSTTSQILQLPATWLVRKVGVGANELNGIVSVNTWHQLLSVIRPFVDLSVTARLVTSGTHDQVIYFLVELRVIVVPLVMCFAPLVSNWAVLFAQYLIPIAKFHARNCKQKIPKRTPTAESTNQLLDAAQYWVLHLCVAGLFTSILPFNILRFISWWYLSWPTTIQWLWSWCGTELVVAVEVLLGEAPLTASSIGRALYGLWQRLPRAMSVCSAAGAGENGTHHSSSAGGGAKVCDGDDDGTSEGSSNRENAPPSSVNSEPRRCTRSTKRTSSRLTYS
jgi:hypothetical protein